MRGCYILIVAFAIVLVDVNAWVTRAESEPGTQHLGDCYTKRHGAMKFGQVERLEGKCATISCAITRTMHIIGCGTVGTAPPCKILPGDLSKPYPECCDYIDCPKKVADVSNSKDGGLEKSPTKDDEDVLTNKAANGLNSGDGQLEKSPTKDEDGVATNKVANGIKLGELDKSPTKDDEGTD